MASLKEQIAALRTATGSGMVDCKKALTATDGSFDGALAWLREKGLASASKKAGRSTSEGLVAVAYGADGRSSASMVEVNCETDFVAKTEVFQDLVMSIATTSEALFVDEAASALDDDARLAALLAAPLHGSDEYSSVNEALTAMIARVGENLRLARVDRVAVADPSLGAVASYIHKPAVAGGALGAQGALVALAQDGSSAMSLDELADVGRGFAMHVVAAQPLYLDREDVPSEVIEKERAILLAEIANEEAEALEAGSAAGKKARKPKPEAVVQKIVAGRIAKFMTENVLSEQVRFVALFLPFVALFLAVIIEIITPSLHFSPPSLSLASRFAL
jgi:elongation factor Ts